MLAEVVAVVGVEDDDRSRQLATPPQGGQHVTDADVEHVQGLSPLPGDGALCQLLSPGERGCVTEVDGLVGDIRLCRLVRWGASTVGDRGVEAALDPRRSRGRGPRHPVSVRHGDEARVIGLSGSPAVGCQWSPPDEPRLPGSCTAERPDQRLCLATGDDSGVPARPRADVSVHVRREVEVVEGAASRPMAATPAVNTRNPPLGPARRDVVEGGMVATEGRH